MNDTDGDGDSYYTYYEPPRTFVKSAIRVMSVLEHFYRDRQPARVIEISRGLDMPLSSAKYLLVSLVESGYLTFDKSSKTYFPSILLTGLASWLSEIYPSGKVLHELARDTRLKLGETVSIAVQHEQYMRTLVIDMASNRTPPSFDFRVRIPMIGSASGSIALASWTDDEVRRFVAQEDLKQPPDQREDTTNQILNHIRQVRQQGYAVREHSLNVDGEQECYTAVAIPLPTAGKSPTLALGVCGIKSALGDKEYELAEAMHQIAARYSERLNPGDYSS